MNRALEPNSMKKLVLAAALAASGSLFAGRPAAHWDVIPYQRVSKTFRAGVVAFHEKGVTVDFTVNGKKVASVDSPKFNGRTKVVEHFFVFDATQYKDGPVTVGATATAPGEEPYRLPDIVLYANANKTLGSRSTCWVDPVNGNDFAAGTKDAPVKFMKQAFVKAGDGGTIFLMPGIYQAKMIGGGLNRKYWTLVTPAPGVDRSQVKFVAGRTGTDKIHFKNVELFCSVKSGYGAIVMGESGETMGWFDNCRFYNRHGRIDGATTPFGNRLRAFVTGGTTENIGTGPFAEIVRGHEISGVSGDAFSGSNGLMVNCTVNDIDAIGNVVERDFYRAFATGDSWVHDTIVYNCNVVGCNGRAFSGTRFRDSAIVNVTVEACAPATVHTQFFGPVENVLFANITVKNQTWQWMTQKDGRANFVPKDVRLFGVKADAFTGFDTVDGSCGLTMLPDYDERIFPKGEK